MADEDADELFRWLARCLWGDAMWVGRHEWVYAGCPVIVEDFCTGIRTLSGAQFSALARILTISEQPEMLTHRRADVAGAAVGRLEVLLTDPRNPHEGVVGDPLNPSLVREALFDIIRHYPSADAVEVLGKCARTWPDYDGDAERSIGRALSDALACCREATTPTNG